MRKPARLVAIGLALCLFGSALSGCYYLRSEPVPEESGYALDLPRLRALAASLPGDRPDRIRSVVVGTASLPGAMMMAGKSWDPVTMTHVAFQLLRPDDSSLIIDSAQDRAMHEATPGGGPFDDEAWDELVIGLESAEQIVITHEHPDHLGGVAKHPRPQALSGRLRLNQAQIDNREALLAVEFPAALLSQVRPLRFESEREDAIAIAPGVVVKRAAGHTPGNQIVFVVMADGSELLFVGDVVWNLDAITELRYRPRFITNWIIDEDRAAGLDLVRTLRDLYDSEEDVHLVISHDARTHAHPAIESGLLLSGR